MRISEFDRVTYEVVRIMVFNATFNNISAISWLQFYWSRKPEYQEKTRYRLAASHWQTLSHNVAWSTPRHERDWNSQR